jgi:hypothetical protein
MASSLRSPDDDCFCHFLLFIYLQDTVPRNGLRPGLYIHLFTFAGPVPALLIRRLSAFMLRFFLIQNAGYYVLFSGSNRAIYNEMIA